MTESEAEDLSNALSPAVEASLVNQKPLDKQTLDLAIRSAMARLGITPEVLIKRHKELLDYENPTINLKASSKVTMPSRTSISNSFCHVSGP